MLKTETLSLQQEHFATKCAEIHYKQRDFAISCSCCDMQTTGYEHFVRHFLELHLEKLQNSKLQESPEIVVEEHMPDFDKTQTAMEADDPLDVEEEAVGKKVQAAVSGLETFDETAAESKEVLALAAKNNKENITNMKNMCKKPTRILRSYSKKTKKKSVKKSKRCSKSEDDDDDDADADDNINDDIAAETTVSQKASTKAAKDDDDCSNSAFVENTSDTESQVVDWSKTYQPKCQKSAYKPRDKPNLCIYCGRLFKRRRHLETHLNIHTGLKPHQCELCGRTFRHLTTLEHHVKMHSKQETFPCGYCDRVFMRYSSKIGHEKQHTMKRTVPCVVCKKLFFTENQMDLHRRKVHPESIAVESDASQLPFLCDICKCRFRTHSYLCTHKSEKHYRTSNIACEQCGKKLGTEKELQEHMKIHAINYASAVK